MPGPYPARQASKGLSVLGSSAPDAINLGRIVRLDGDVPEFGGKMRYGGQLHTLVFGPNGSGKSTRLLLPNLLELEDRSIVVVDPKGELAAVSAPYRRTLGEVVIINPFGILAGRPGYEDLKSDGFNPMVALDPTAPSFNADAALLAEALIKVESSDPHWDGSARSLLAAIIMYVCIEARRTGNIPVFSDVRELLCMASEEPNERNGYRGRGIPELAREMMQSSVAGLRNKAGQFNDWTNEIRSIASAAKRQTEPFDDDEIASDLARGTFDFREMKKRPVTVYIVLPPEMIERHSKWIRLVLTSALRGVMRAREKGEPRTLFMIDEFAALGHLQIIETVWALVRGYGIQIMPVLQDLNQLKALYKERWETFIGMSGAVVSFGARDLTTAKWMSERAGDMTDTAENRSKSSSVSENGTSTSESLSWQQIKVPFLVPQKFFAVRNGFMFMWLAGMSETISAYAPYYGEVIKLEKRARENPYKHASG
ncbi:MAG: type IV secretory system conjugative DNA transfer family protein [Rhizomicrobium sp.]